MKGLEIKVRIKEVGMNYETNKSFLFDKVYVVVNGLEFAVNGSDIDAKRILKSALIDDKKKLYLYRGEDQSFEGGTPYPTYYTVIDDNEIGMKVSTRTAKNLINKKLEEGGDLS